MSRRWRRLPPTCCRYRSSTSTSCRVTRGRSRPVTAPSTPARWRWAVRAFMSPPPVWSQRQKRSPRACWRWTKRTFPIRQDNSVFAGTDIAPLTLRHGGPHGLCRPQASGRNGAGPRRDGVLRSEGHGRAFGSPHGLCRRRSRDRDRRYSRLCRRRRCRHDHQSTACRRTNSRRRRARYRAGAL